MSTIYQLTKHPFTRQFPAPVLERLAVIGVAVQYQPRNLILTEGKPADRFLLIEHGKVAVEINCPGRSREVLQTMGPGEVVGWSWLLEPFESAFDVVCLTEVSGAEFDGPCLRQLMDIDHELGFYLSRGLVEVVAGRLQATRLRLLDMYAPRPDR